MEGAILSLRELRGINSTMCDPSDKIEHKIQKESKSFYASDLLLYNKPSQTEECKTIIILAYLMTLGVSSSDRTAVGKTRLCATTSEPHLGRREEQGDSDTWALE